MTSPSKEPLTPQRKQDRAITFLTQEEVQRLFDAIKTKRDRAIFAVAYRHGLRASEVGMLQLTDLDLRPHYHQPRQRFYVRHLPAEARHREAPPLLHQEPEGRFPLFVYIQPHAPH